MKKILIYTYNYNKMGGIEKLVRDYIYFLKKYHKITVISDNNLLLLSKFKLLKKLYFLKLCEKYDVILVMHPFLLKNFFYNHIKKLNLVTLTYGIDVWGKNGTFIKKELNLVRNIITISNFTKLKLIGLVDKDKIFVIPPVVNIEEFKYKNLNKVLPFILLTVGRLDANEQYKGHDLVIKALALLKNKNLDIIYNIIGDGTDRTRLENLAKKLRVDDKVKFLGKLSFEDIKKAYHDCHLFIMPSFYSIRTDGSATGEGFGIVYLEAGASGRAVIGCDVGGQTDYIIDGENGLLVRPDEKDIAKKIEYIYGQFDLLEEMGKKGRKIVEKKFSMERFERDLKNFLDNITYK